MNLVGILQTVFLVLGAAAFAMYCGDSTLVFIAVVFVGYAVMPKL